MKGLLKLSAVVTLGLIGCYLLINKEAKESLKESTVKVLNYYYKNELTHKQNIIDYQNLKLQNTLNKYEQEWNKFIT